MCCSRWLLLFLALALVGCGSVKPAPEPEPQVNGALLSIWCDCRCVKETDGLPIAGNVVLLLAITETGLCDGHLGEECATEADVPPGGHVEGTIVSCNTRVSH